MLPFSIPPSQAVVSCLPLPVSFWRLCGVWVGLGAPCWCGVCLVTLATLGQRCGMTVSDQRTVYRDQEVKTQPCHRPVGAFPILRAFVHGNPRTAQQALLPRCPFQGILRWLEAEVLATALALPLPSLFFLSDSLSFPVSSSLHAHSLAPSPQHSCCLAHSIYSGIFRVITIKLLKGDNPAEEAGLTLSPILSLA